MSVLASPSQQPAALFADLPAAIGQVALFHETASDTAFLRRLYRSTRDDELAAVCWSEAIKQSFCDSQFDLQRTHYRRTYPAGEFLIVRAGDGPAGRLYLDAGCTDVHLIDIALLPEWRRRGIGTMLLNAVAMRAAAVGKAVSLQVAVWNRAAFDLYRRNGFVPGVRNGSHIEMRRLS